MRGFSNVLLVVDSCTDRSAVLQRAVTLAKNNQASLTICAVIDAIPAEMQMAITAVAPAELADIAFSETQDQLAQIVKDFDEAGVSIRTKVMVGRPFIEIIRQVLVNGHDLVIKSTEGTRGLTNVLFGSTDMKLMRKCPCPVWLIKPTAKPRFRRILAAVDQDPEDAAKDALNRQILEMSTSLALAEFSELHIVHAWHLFGESYLRGPRTGLSATEVDSMVLEEAGERKRWLENLVNSYGVKADRGAVGYLKPQLHVVEGDARSAVPATARELDVDLIVMGTVARVGVPGLLIGNTAESILNQIDCSVLTIKPPGFESPITLEA